MPASNVLFIVVDQWRGDCLGALGHPVVQTPHLDRLAARGVSFANHWSVTAPCGPSRASLLTGLHAMHHRSVGNGTPLDDRFDTLARLARAAGYDPTLFGYTDTSIDPRTVTDPHDPRLHDYEGVLPGFSVGTLLTEGNPRAWTDWLRSLGHDVPTDRLRLHDPAPDHPGAHDRGSTRAPTWFPAEHSETAFLTGEAMAWLDRTVGGSPWFAHVAYIRPHPPYRAPEGYYDLYDPADGPSFRRHPDRAVEVAQHRLHEAAVHITGCSLDEAELRQTRATYWGNMTEVDHQVGRLLAHLDHLGATDDTLIVLTADHGDQMGDHWLMEKVGWWDESFHVPLIVVDPRSEADASRGRVVREFTESVDVLPTICEWMGIEVPAAVDGRALQPFLHGAPAPPDWRTEAHWQWDYRDPVHHLAEEMWDLTMEECALDVVRSATSKYVHLASGECLYFDLEDDPDQVRDRSGDPAVAAAINDARGRLLSWRMRHDDRTLTGHRLTAASGLVVRRDARR